MPLSIDSEPVPLSADADGIYHVGNTRVTLDTLVAALCEGATPEEMVDQYPTIRLDDAYAVIDYSLRHRPEVDSYLAERRSTAVSVRAETESRSSPHGIRDRLMSRRTVAR